MFTLQPIHAADIRGEDDMSVYFSIGASESLLLFLLEEHGEKRPYELCELSQNELNENSIYTILKKLISKQFISKTYVSPRVYNYSLTELGHATCDYLNLIIQTSNEETTPKGDEDGN